MLNRAHSRRATVDRAQPVEFHEPSSVLHNRPRPAARPRTETGRAQLSQRGLGGGAARWRRWRLPGAGKPVRGVRRTGRNLRRRRGGEIRGRPSRPRPQRRVFDYAGEAVTSKTVIARLDRATQYCRAFAVEHWRRSVLDHPPSRVTTSEVGSASRPRLSVKNYALSVSRNRTGSPVDGAITSPCHITRRPRTKVPTGQPVTRTPSYGVQPAREATQLLVMVSLRLRSTIVKSASYPAAIRPLQAMLNSRAGPALVRSTNLANDKRPALT